MLKIPAPRLLPATIATMAALLLLKCGVLVEAAVTHGARPESVMVASANAAGTEAAKEHEKEHGKSPAVPPAGNVPSEADQQKAAATAAPAIDVPPPVSESEKVLLQELRQRRKDLEARADAVTTRESVLVATELKLGARLVELQTLQRKLEGLYAAQKQKEESGWQGLVKMYETMKPKDAATIFNDLSMPVLLQVIDRMKDSKGSAVMAAMNPDKARDVTSELAQLRTGRDASGGPLAGSRPSLAGG